MHNLTKLCLLVFFSICTFTAYSQLDIADARALPEGTEVTIQGIVTNGSSLGIIRYVQDDTGGIPAYPGSGSVADFPDNVTQGDLVSITGELKSFRGLLEIDPITAYDVISSNNPLPSPKTTSPDGINEENEGLLLRIENVIFADGGSTFAVGNYSFEADGETSEIYVRSNHPLIGTQIPLAAVHLVGISSEFDGSYQLLLRGEGDIEIADAFYIDSPPRQTNISQDNFTLSWTTNIPGTSVVRYGTNPNVLDKEIEIVDEVTDHSINLTELQPATFYYVEASSSSGTSTATSPVKVYSTASRSSGDFYVYFTAGVDERFSNGSQPTGITPAALEAAIIDKINSATQSIDVSMYNNNRRTIVDALSDAFERGVRVRYIMDDKTNNDALSNPPPPFTTLRGNTGDPLMHNKFLVIDVDQEQDSWVIMGSTNFTEQNLQDYNNMIMIQDQAIAKAYEMEFEEMWGSDNDVPGVFNVKFGADKADNTPHLFNVNGMSIESYFSPSDNTTASIADAIETADSDLQFSILTFTHNSLGSAVLDAHQAGVEVRGVIDNTGDTGTEYNFLLNNGVNVTGDNQDTQTHHKYCIVDATDPDSDPQVVTGSHNWSASAETRNDENTLIFHSADIANIFLQEFEARWCEIFGGSDCISNITETENEIPLDVFPNPAYDKTYVSISVPEAENIIISLLNANGQLLQSSLLQSRTGIVKHPVNLDKIAAGQYYVLVQIGDKQGVKKLTVME